MNKYKDTLWSALKNEYTLAANGHFKTMLFNIVFVVFEVFYTLGFVMALEEMMSIYKDKSLPAWEKWFSLAMSAVAAVTSFTVGIIIFMVSAPCVMLLITLIGSSVDVVLKKDIFLGGMMVLLSLSMLFLPFVTIDGLLVYFVLTMVSAGIALFYAVSLIHIALYRMHDKTSELLYLNAETEMEIHDAYIHDLSVLEK